MSSLYLVLILYHTPFLHSSSSVLHIAMRARLFDLLDKLNQKLIRGKHAKFRPWSRLPTELQSRILSYVVCQTLEIVAMDYDEHISWPEILFWGPERGSTFPSRNHWGTDLDSIISTRNRGLVSLALEVHYTETFYTMHVPREWGLVVLPLYPRDTCASRIRRLELVGSCWVGENAEYMLGSIIHGENNSWPWLLRWEAEASRDKAEGYYPLSESMRNFPYSPEWTNWANGLTGVQHLRLKICLKKFPKGENWGRLQGRALENLKWIFSVSELAVKAKHVAVELEPVEMWMQQKTRKELEERLKDMARRRDS